MGAVSCIEPVFAARFDDFKDRAIQFGYLVLFAPAYPLAPVRGATAKHQHMGLSLMVVLHEPV
jgi:hypothetical protein